MNTEREQAIKEAGWWHGTESEWQRLSMEEREELAFKATGCMVAYPTWAAPVNCVHVHCQIRRGEKPAIYETESTLDYEREYGWLRFMDEKPYRALRTAIIAKAQETGIYDPSKLEWQAIVFPGILVLRMA